MSFEYNTYTSCEKALTGDGAFFKDFHMFVKMYSKDGWQVRTCIRHHLAKRKLSTNDVTLDSLRNWALRHLAKNDEKCAPPEPEINAATRDPSQLIGKEIHVKLTGEWSARLSDKPSSIIQQLKKETTMKAFEKRDFIQGRPAAEVSDDEIFGIIAKTEADIRNLETIEHKPKSLLSKIESMRDDIKQLVFYVDNRNKKSK